MINKKDFLKQFLKLVNEHKKIIITSHKSPDPDSVASVLGLNYFLKTIFKKQNVTIVYEDKPNNATSLFSNPKEITFVEDLSKEVNKEDLLIILDTNEPNRFTDFFQDLINTKVTTVCIDHHIKYQEDLPYNLSYIDINSIALTHNIYDLFLKEKVKELDVTIAEFLMLGILADSGFFNFLRKDKTSILNTAKDLIDNFDFKPNEFGVKYFAPTKEIFKGVQILHKSLNFKKLPNFPEFSYTHLTKEDLQQNDLNDLFVARRSFAKNLYNVNGVNWGFIVYPSKDKGWDITFRSLPNTVDCQKLAKDFFAGGGHINAAGGHVTDEEISYKEVLEIVFKRLS